MAKNFQVIPQTYSLATHPKKYVSAPLTTAAKLNHHLTLIIIIAVIYHLYPAFRKVFIKDRCVQGTKVNWSFSAFLVWICLGSSFFLPCAGLLIFCDVAILHNWPQIATFCIIHQKSHNSGKIAKFEGRTRNYLLLTTTIQALFQGDLPLKKR